MIRQYIQTIKAIFSHPQNVVDSFIHTEKSGYQHPFLFCLIGVLVILIINLFLVDFSFDPVTPQVDGGHEQIQELAVWMDIAAVRASTQFLPLSMFLLLIPLLSLPGLFFFRDQMDSFYSNLILNSYTVGASLAAFLILIPAWALLEIPLTDSFMNTTLPAIVTGVIGLWIYKNYFQATKFSVWVRIFSSWITGYMLFIFVKGFAAGIIGYMLFAIARIYELSGG